MFNISMDNPHSCNKNTFILREHQLICDTDDRHPEISGILGDSWDPSRNIEDHLLNVWHFANENGQS